mgnify:CR=1 FL=1
MKLTEIVTILESIAPPELAEDFDRGKIGLILKGDQEVRKIATSLDPTPYAIRKAIEMDAQMLITHHTLIWNPVTVIGDELAQKLRSLFEGGLSIYSMHTNYDRADGGVNDVLAGLLGMHSVQPCGIGRIGCVEETGLKEFSEKVSESLETPVECIGDPGKRVKKIVSVAGSGFREGLETAKHFKADVLISSELKHEVIRERGDVALISAPHYNTEAPAMRALAKRLCEYIPAEYIEDPPEIRVVNCVERHI